MMTKRTAFVGWFLFFCATLFAQVAVDPSDRFYIEAQMWELRGITGPLPQIRPYSLNVVKRVLESVIAVGLADDGTVVPQYQTDVDIALNEYERIFSRPYQLIGEVGGRAKTQQTIDTTTDSRTSEYAFKKMVEARGAVAGDIAPHPLVGLSYNVGLYANTTDWTNVTPYYSNFAHDAIQDPAEVGPIDVYLDANSNVSIGTQSLYGMAGVSRVGFGSFLGDGMCFNETAYHSANMFFNLVGEKWAYATLFSSIGATTNVNTESTLAGDKYFGFHAIRYSLTPRLDISFYESIVYGARTDLSYLFPAPFMAIQGINGNNDNLQMGLLIEHRLVNGLKWCTDVFIDDFDANKAVKLKFDAKNRVGFQSGFLYTPAQSPCRFIAMNYTLITPYTYSHWQYVSEESGEIKGTSFNYQNYTNNGINIGSPLQPDSDKVSFQIQFVPKKNFTLTIASSFIRHQNVIEALQDDEAIAYVLSESGTYATDGSVFTHSMMGDPTADSGDHVESAWDHLLFMAGKHDMYVCQAGIAGEYEIPSIKKLRATIKFGYTFEYIHNKGIDENIYTGRISSVERDSTGAITKWMYNGTEYTDKDTVYALAKQDADADYQNWVNNLHDQVNHYFSLSVKVAY